jgi:hypothetical protein
MSMPERDKRVRTAERRLTQLKDERDLLLRAHYAGAVPIDQLRDEQERIAVALAVAEREVSARRLGRDQLKQALERFARRAEASGGSTPCASTDVVMGGDRCGPSTIQGSSKAPGGRLCRQTHAPQGTRTKEHS